MKTEVQQRSNEVQNGCYTAASKKRKLENGENETHNVNNEDNGIQGTSKINGTQDTKFNLDETVTRRHKLIG